MDRNPHRAGAQCAPNECLRSLGCAGVAIALERNQAFALIDGAGTLDAYDGLSVSSFLLLRDTASALAPWGLFLETRRVGSVGIFGRTLSRVANVNIRQARLRIPSTNCIGLSLELQRHWTNATGVQSC